MKNRKGVLAPRRTYLLQRRPRMRKSAFLHSGADAVARGKGRKKSTRTSIFIYLSYIRLDAAARCRRRRRAGGRAASPPMPSPLPRPPIAPWPPSRAARLLCRKEERRRGGASPSGIRDIGDHRHGGRRAYRLQAHTAALPHIPCQQHLCHRRRTRAGGEHLSSSGARRAADAVIRTGRCDRLSRGAGDAARGNTATAGALFLSPSTSRRARRARGAGAIAQAYSAPCARRAARRAPCSPWRARCAGVRGRPIKKSSPWPLSARLKKNYRPSHVHGGRARWLVLSL